MDKQRVCAYIIGDLGAGGQERQLTYLLKEIKKNGGRSILIVWNNSDIEKFKNEIHECCLDLKIFDSNQSTIKKITESKKLISTYDAKTLHCFTFYLNFFSWLITIGTNTIPIGGIRSRVVLHLKSTGPILGSLSIIFPKFKISNNQNFIMGLDNIVYKYFLKNTFVIQNHLDVALFKNHFYTIGNEIKTASIGRLYEEKRIDLMVDIISSLVKKGFQIKHFHAGKGVLFEKLMEKIISENLQNHFFFIGEIDDVSKFLSDKSFFIHTSDFEGFPNVIMEAMSCGKAILTTNSGDTSFLVTNGVNGFLVPCGDKNTLIEKCTYLILNPEEINEMGIQGRSFAEKHFHLDELFKNTMKVYNQICAA